MYALRGKVEFQIAEILMFKAEKTLGFGYFYKYSHIVGFSIVIVAVWSPIYKHRTLTSSLLLEETFKLIRKYKHYYSGNLKKSMEKFSFHGHYF